MTDTLSLTEREQMVMEWRNAIPKRKLREIADALGVSVSYTQQIAKQAQRKVDQRRYQTEIGVIRTTQEALDWKRSELSPGTYNAVLRAVRHNATLSSYGLFLEYLRSGDLIYARDIGIARLDQLRAVFLIQGQPSKKTWGQFKQKLEARRKIKKSKLHREMQLEKVLIARQKQPKVNHPVQLRGSEWMINGVVPGSFKSAIEFELENTP